MSNVYLYECIRTWTSYVSRWGHIKLALAMFVCNPLTERRLLCSSFPWLKHALEYGLSFGYTVQEGHWWIWSEFGGDTQLVKGITELERRKAWGRCDHCLQVSEGELKDIKSRGQTTSLQKDSGWLTRKKFSLTVWLPNMEWTALGMDSHPLMSQWIIDKSWLEDPRTGELCDLNQLSFECPKLCFMILEFV